MSAVRIKTITSDSKIKCKKCRNVVVEQCCGSLVTGHGVKVHERAELSDKDNCGVEDSVWYLDDDSAPSWIMERVTEENWTKGRLNCKKCGTRIGSFDFTSGTRCECSQCVLPGVRLIKTKVDL